MFLINKYNSLFAAGARQLLPLAIAGVCSAQALANETFVLEEIIVTAQKRAESVQDVPIAISALSENFIQNVGAQDTSDLGLYTPGLETRVYQATQPEFNIRGIVTNDFGIGADPAVAVYVDGVYSGRSGASMTAFQDVERVEVLKGPQGTLFGKNAAAGAIHLITKKPGEEFEANVGVTVGNHGKQKLDAMVNLPLTDSLFLRMNAMTNERDGYRENTTTGKDVGDENNAGVRAGLLWNVSENTDVFFRMEYVDVDQSASDRYGLVNGGDIYGDVNLDGAGSESLNLWGSSVTVESDLGSTVLTSITSSKRFESYNRVDEDGTDIFGVYFDSVNEEENSFFSQEFRLVSNDDSDLRWTLGAMYSREHAKQRTTTEFSSDLIDRALLTDAGILAGLAAWNANVGIPFFGTSYTAETAPAGFGWDILLDPTGSNIAAWGTPAAGGQSLLGQLYTETAIGELKSYSSAIYGDMTYSVTDQLDFTLGIRYTVDKKEYALLVPGSTLGMPSFGIPSLEIGFANQEPALKRTEDWENGSFRAVFDYTFSEDAMAYLSYATGYKAGGFNSTIVSDPFKPEEVTNIELGLKSTWLDGRLRVNGSVYTYEYDGLQELELVTPVGGTLAVPTVRSIDSEADGAELEVTWLATETLLLSANYSYLDSEITNFPLFAGESSALSREGNPQSSVAKNTYSLGAEYTLPLENLGELAFRVDYSYSGKRENAPLGSGPASGLVLAAQYEDEITDGYQDVSARITFRDSDGHWRASLYGQNLTNEEYLYMLGGLGVLSGSPSTARVTPRLYGLEISYTY